MNIWMCGKNFSTGPDIFVAKIGQLRLANNAADLNEEIHKNIFLGDGNKTSSKTMKKKRGRYRYAGDITVNIHQNISVILVSNIV